MKRTLLLFSMLVVATMGRDIIKQVADGLDLTREEVQTCFNETDVTSEDIIHYDQHVASGKTRTSDHGDSILKVGCFHACSMKKKGAMTGAHINTDKIKEVVVPSWSTKPDELARYNQITDTCANQVKSETNECEVGLKYVLCLIDEDKAAREGTDDNE